MTHSYHPDMHEFGLSDSCERCAFQSQHPVETLDDRMIHSLIGRIENNLPPRSDAERLAMEMILQEERSLVAKFRMARIGAPL